MLADHHAVAQAAADEIASCLSARPGTLLLAATGHTPMDTYAELARRRATGTLDTSRLRVAQLDEYLGVPLADPRSLQAWTRRAVVEPLGIGEDRFIGLDAMAKPAEACAAYDQALADAGGADLALLGLGPNGHLGFNEPGSDAAAPTRRVALAPESIESNARYWGSTDAVPREALTAGMSVIMAARRVVLVVTGTRKQGVLRRLLDEPPSDDLPASWLRQHPWAMVLADREALP